MFDNYYGSIRTNRVISWLSPLLHLAKTVGLGFLVQKTAYLFYKPYLPSYDPTFTGAEFAAAGERACLWIILCIVLLDVLHTRKLQLTTWRGWIAYGMMWVLNLYLMFEITTVFTMTYYPTYGDNTTHFRD